MQHCPRCDQDLPLDDYHPDKQGKPGNYCRNCTVEYMQRWRRQRGIKPKARRVCRHEGCDKPPPSKNAKYCSPQHRPPATPRREDLSNTYRAVHKRLQRQRGPAADHPCAHCDQQAQQWAYDHTDPDEAMTEWYGKTVAYSTKSGHYQPLCRRCHKRLDAPYEGSALQRINEQRRAAQAPFAVVKPYPLSVTK
jgi:hypothetical protein